MVGERTQMRLHLFRSDLDRSGLVIGKDSVMQDHARHQTDHKDDDEQPHSQAPDY